MNKKCTGCKDTKPVAEFSRWSRGNDGYQNYCKLCNRKYLKGFNVDYLPKRRNGDQSNTGSLLNHIYLKMLDRCNNQGSEYYHRYGGRGIKVCDSWLSWDKFKEDMLDTYSPGLSIERKDVNLGYSKENCIWIEKEKQGLNKEDTIRITVNGELVSLTEHSRELGFAPSTIRKRYHLVGDNYAALFRPHKSVLKVSEEVKKFIADNFYVSTEEILESVQESFNLELTGIYVRQLKSDWKTNKAKSVLLKLVGPWSQYAHLVK
jgi:hypothetical protein